jgi:hypothetical protein
MTSSLYFGTEITKICAARARISEIRRVRRLVLAAVSDYFMFYSSLFSLGLTKKSDLRSCWHRVCALVRASGDGAASDEVAKMKRSMVSWSKLWSGALMSVALLCGAPAESQALITPQGVYSKVEGASLDALKRQWEEVSAARQAELVTLKRLEADYQRLADDIAKRKRSARPDRKALEAQLRQANKLADELDGVQRRVRALEDRLDELGAAVAARLDAELRDLERSIHTASGAQRARYVARLNEMSRERAKYAQPAPRLDQGQLREMLKLADKLDSPSDMMALADELQDAEADVRARLDWVSKRLEELRARQRLVRRARSFAREEGFFEEGDRSRVVARVDRQTSVNAPARGESASPSAPPQVGNSESLNAAPPQAVDNNFDVTNGGGRGQSDDIPAPGPSFVPDDGYGEPSRVDVVVVAREADPAAASRGPADVAGGLDGKIRKLEADEADLKRQAETLKRRAASLRDEARRSE